MLDDITVVWDKVELFMVDVDEVVLELVESFTCPVNPVGFKLQIVVLSLEIGVVAVGVKLDVDLVA